MAFLFGILLFTSCEKIYTSECLECTEYLYTTFLGFTTHYADTTYIECYDEPVMEYTESLKYISTGIQHPFAEMWIVKICEIKKD